MLNQTKYVVPFSKVEYIEGENGYIVWRRGSGDNVELLHIRTYEGGKGTGRELVRLMILKLKTNPPYATVFGFTRSPNAASQLFYKALGFDLTQVKGVYADGTAVVFSQLYSVLLEQYNER